MESSSFWPPTTCLQPPPLFLDLPTEVRLRVYELLYEEITIHCAPRPPTNLSTGHTNHVSPDLSLLLTASKIYHEAKPFLDAAPVAVTGDSSGQANPRKFPPHVLRRVTSLIHPNPGYLFLTPPKNVLELVMHDRLSCPNLRLIHKLPYFDDLDNPGFLGYVRRMLEAFRHDQPQTSRDYPPARAAMLQNFRSIVIEEPTRRYIQENLNKMDTIIKESDLTLKCSFRFFIRLIELSDAPSRRCVDTEWFNVVMVWDRDGLRIEGFPELKSRPWWKRYCERNSPSNDVPSSVQRVEFYLIEEPFFPMRWFIWEQPTTCKHTQQTLDARRFKSR